MINKIMREDFAHILADKNIDWSRFANTTVLVTGANGFLPSYIVQSLLFLNEQKIQNPVKIIGIVRNLNKAKQKYKDYQNDKNLVLIEHDVSMPFSIEEPIDYIIHAASQASPKYFFSDPVGTIKANTLGTSHMLELAKEKSVKSFLYFSSGEVNGDMFEHKECVAEDDYGRIDPADIRNCYAESKKMGENMCACWAYQYGVPAKIVRPSHTYGPGFSLDDGRAFSSFVAAVLNEKNIILKSDGSARRSFLYLSDAVRGYIKVLLDGDGGGAYNVGNDAEISILELARLIVKVSHSKKSKIEIHIDPQNVSSKVSHGLLDNRKLKNLGWKPEISEEEGFSRTLESFKL